MNAGQFRSCPNDETLAAFINRRGLSKASYREVQQHVLACDNCRAIFGSVISFEEWSRDAERSPPHGRRFFLAYLALGVVILATIVGVLYLALR
jgi:hypothetical protein